MDALYEDNNIVVKLSQDEAIVMLEWLANFNANEHPSLFEHESEKRLLFDLEAVLEKTSSTIFNDNHTEILLNARNRICSSDDF